MTWIDDNPLRSLEEKILTAAQRYEQKEGQYPNICWLPTSLELPDNLDIPGVNIIRLSTVTPGHFVVGYRNGQGE